MRVKSSLGVRVGVGPAAWSADPTTKYGSEVALSMTAAYEKTGASDWTRITPLAVCTPEAPAST